MTEPSDTPLAGAWPDASLLPSEDASNREWAAFYRDRLGLIVLPMPADPDVISHAMSMARAAVAAHIDDHGEEPDETTRLALWDEARELAEAARKGPIGYIEQFARQKIDFAGDVTDDLLDLWFVPLPGARGPRREADRRGICVRAARSSKGFPLVLVDVDPRHGGDLAGAWGAGLAGPQARTPGGGLHTLMLATGKERNSNGALGPGVDVVASTPIALPAGRLATPGRSWVRWDAPVTAPPALTKAKPFARKVSLTVGQQAHQRDPGDEDDVGTDAGGPGRAALAMSTEVDDGERNDRATLIVGMLARPCACPPDFVAACLDTFVEWLAGHDKPSQAVREETERWRRALTRGPRDAEFAAEVLRVWYETRNVARSRWKTTPERFALSLWKTCDLHLGGEAGAEDLGAGPVLAIAPAGWLATPLPAPPADPPPTAATCKDPLQVAATATPPTSPVEEPPPDPTPPPPAPPPSPAQQAAEAAAASARWRGGIDPRTYVLTLSETYTDDDLAADLAREPIQIGEVMPAIDFNTRQYSERGTDALAGPLYHGWGEGLNQAMGGLRAGDFVVIGASGAGAGKTWFACWLANGLAMQTATRLLEWQGQTDAPLVLPIWVTEMMSKSDLYLRLAGAHLGFDVAAITRGRQAHEAPGILAMAQRLGMTPDEVVGRARMLERVHGTSVQSPMGLARHHLIKHVKLSRLPRRSRQAGIVVDHRSGPMLVDHLADAVDCYREQFAAAAGVTTDKVFPLVVIDPTQRFVSGDSEKRAIDEFVGAAAQVLCSELDAAVVVTCDTTKAAATDIRVTDFLGAEAKALEARVLAGSYGIVHNATHCVLLQSEPLPDGGLRSRQWARLTKCRSGGPAASGFPFGWERHLGRFIPEAPESLSKFAEAAAAQGQQKRPGVGQAAYTGPRFGVASPAMLRRDHERERD